ncbi:MFS transporter [Motiliproteus sediminis]|uniref:MFS transporter n=1 Tax=Motiliproteus sediminis TaxID=1468178 RepID=UPI001AEFA945|nr:MFS transporter [Motiliproteus sediminis]
MSGSYPYWRLSLFYLFYFALLGGLVPYWALYLESLNFNPEQIGLLMAILMGTRIIAPNLWGWLADHSGQRLAIIRGGSLVALLVFSAAFWVDGFASMALLMFGFTFFWNAVLPQFEVVTLRAMGTARNRYSHVRLWGSIGFILAVVGIGALLDRVGMAALVPTLWLLLASIWLASLWVKVNVDRAVESSNSPALWAVLKRREIQVFLLICMLVQLGHGPYYTFYSVFMQEHGYGKTAIGSLWALGVIAEVAVFLVMHRLLQGWGLRRIFIGGLWICALRWLLISQWPDLAVVVVGAQLLHAVTFGCLHAASIAFVHQYFPSASQGQGQALYSSVGFGLGGALGAYLSGVAWSMMGGPQVFMAAAIVSAAGAILAWRMLRVD